MRIAVSGAHGTGKSTLVAELARRLPGYEVGEESYHTLVAEGHAFASEPSRDELEVLFDHSCSSLSNTEAEDLVLDRCPVDYLGYLIALPGEVSETLRRWFDRAAAAMARLDLVVFVPIEDPDRIDVSTNERRLRRRVDLALREIIVEDTWGLAPRVVEVSGAPGERVEQVLAHVGAT